MLTKHGNNDARFLLSVVHIRVEDIFKLKRQNILLIENIAVNATPE